ncbi:MAG: hypothetical protein UY31_C0021G0006 [Candidatus Wolfebacteria bacterium GW2011_GWE1_48_7]|uniref:Uncharacterized protein n=2 Tax=Candidatus Wolfeibacteriota TaxID=1752735 RepID=A0A0G1U7L4_9BACT|nr:MAG: hypothetical protein UX70_C0001G0698 [Candidatus Wolfebacteria bacterium GW2011_GWB1_47_1]KKU37082.1 MAG: hypothetical protein UX49_C0002G0007 [Candidatus Wolfebacteria bacterium GW2011_GWC2_46_275]KKU42380.1 MAG: hypothetical protein UX58_C0002G0094 [Candidatus Wolfebacteria bacterium GW2011_GWB2_46_69]KKU54346.1 MAG: hypothetical protein UX76_C0003G0042 [Candidatus Wolfebacteria bacterium GW2011_GWC1_47_103]KKU59529.1 MAG: hypothetical protein UX83_C0004G0031 [Candidatus Wolfebacteria
MPPKYKYIVVPRNHFSNETIVAALAETCAASGNEVTFPFQSKEKKGYYVAHEFITRLKNNGDSRIKIEFYEQAGDRPIKKYGIPAKKSSKKLREAKKRLKELVAAKGK